MSEFKIPLNDHLKDLHPDHPQCDNAYNDFLLQGDKVVDARWRIVILNMFEASEFISEDDTNLVRTFYECRKAIDQFLRNIRRPNRFENFMEGLATPDAMVELSEKDRNYFFNCIYYEIEKGLFTMTSRKEDCTLDETGIRAIRQTVQTGEWRLFWKTPFMNNIPATKNFIQKQCEKIKGLGLIQDYNIEQTPKKVFCIELQF